MKTSPLISIITINYNNRDGLKKTIDSVVAQSFLNYEHIIIDGGSTDGSVDVIKAALENKDYASRLGYWCSEKDGGIYPAMNKGIGHANGEYCLMLNSGDFLAKNDVLQKAASRDFTEDIVYCDAYFVKGKRRRRIHYPNKIYGRFFFLRGFCHQSVFIKTSLQKKNLYSTEYKIVNDSDFFMKVFLEQNCSARHLPIALSCYDAEGGFSSTSGDLHDKEYAMLIDKYYPARVQEDLRSYILICHWPRLLYRTIKRFLLAALGRI